LTKTLQQINYSNAQFVLSAEKPKDWVEDLGAEVAFVGRSNVGKSSAINKITNRRGLARTSKTPGRTQHVVFFEVAEDIRLVDLPGYGFAKTPIAVRNHWQTFINTYLSSRKTLKALFIPMDIRRPFTELDQQMMNWADELQLPVHILLTKSDKLSRGKAKSVLIEVEKKWLGEYDCTIQLFSASKGTGVDEARGHLTKWLSLPADENHLEEEE
jgi:GTP-binding protein